MRRKMDRMLQENQALRFEVDVKGNALGESQDRIAALKGEVNKRELITAMKSEDPKVALMRSKELTYVDQTSVIIRVHDNQ